MSKFPVKIRKNELRKLILVLSWSDWQAQEGEKHDLIWRKSEGKKYKWGKSDHFHDPFSIWQGRGPCELLAAHAQALPVLPVVLLLRTGGEAAKGTEWFPCTMLQCEG